MKSVMAHHVLGIRKHSGVFTCSRCGIHGTYNSKRPRPVLCRDCREIERGVA